MRAGTNTQPQAAPADARPRVAFTTSRVAVVVRDVTNRLSRVRVTSVRERAIVHLRCPASNGTSATSPNREQAQRRLQQHPGEIIRARPDSRNSIYLWSQPSARSGRIPSRETSWKRRLRGNRSKPVLAVFMQSGSPTAVRPRAQLTVPPAGNGQPRDLQPRNNALPAKHPEGETHRSRNPAQSASGRLSSPIPRPNR